MHFEVAISHGQQAVQFLSLVDSKRGKGLPVAVNRPLHQRASVIKTV